MLEKEFNKAITNVVNLLVREDLMDANKLVYLKGLKKETIDSENNIKNLAKNAELKLDIRKSKLVELEYTKLILSKYLNENYPYLSEAEKEICIYKSIKKIFKLEKTSNKEMELKEELFEYAKTAKLGLFFQSVNEIICNKKLKDGYGESWDKFLEEVEAYTKESKTNPNRINHLINAQKTLAVSCLEDLSKYSDVSDYIVRVQYVLNTPIQDKDAMEDLVHKCDLKFLDNNNVNRTSGLSKLYTLRDTIAAINSTTNEETKNRYIAEYNYLINAFNKLNRQHNK